MNRGFKIINGHFKLGSKAHIEDFVHAQRLFQYSRYTDRFAYFISNKIAAKTNSKEKILILGYGHYSEMLIEKTIFLLNNNNKLNDLDISYNLLKDTNTPTFLREFSKDIFYYQNAKIFIVVPIATTLSTGIKVSKAFKTLMSIRFSDEFAINPIDEYFNLILVTGPIPEFDKNTKITDLPKNDIKDINLLKLFKWNSHNKKNKTITVEDSNGNNTIQKYFIHIETKWFESSNCSFCYPESKNRFNERVILTTDKVSVNPEIFITNPNRFNKSNFTYGIKQNNGIHIPSSCYSKKHINENNRHFIHYIEPNPFYIVHQKAIFSWLTNIKKDIKGFSSPLIITPAREGNLYFVNKVRELVFDDNVKILQYSTEKSYNQNHQIFFSDLINNSDGVFFVDDFIQSGTTFLRIHNFIRNHNTKLSGLICMMNKADRFGLTTIYEHLPKVASIDKKLFYPFFDINVKAIKRDTCTMCNERKMYLELADESVLDSLKIIFLKRARKLKENFKYIKVDSKRTFLYQFEIHKYSIEDQEKNKILISLDGEDDKIILDSYNDKLNHYFLKFLTRHFLNKVLISNDINKKSFDIINHIINPTTELILKNILDDCKELSLERYNFLLKSYLKDLITKTLAQPEFREYINLKKQTAKFVLFNLKLIEKELLTYFEKNDFLENIDFDKTEDIDNIYNKLANGYALIRKFKFYLRRSVILQLNYIIHPETLKFINDIYSLFNNNRTNLYGKNNDGVLIHLFNYFTEKTNATARNEIQTTIISELIYTLSIFNYNYISLIKELIHFEPTKALRVNEVLKQIDQEIPFENRNPQFNRLIYLLKYENIGLFTKGISNMLNLNDYKYPKIISTDKKPIKFSTYLPSLIKWLSKIQETKNDDRIIINFFDFIQLKFSNNNILNFDRSKIDDFKQTVTILRTIYLHILLNEKQLPFPEKILGITRNLNRIVCIPEIDNLKFSNNLINKTKDNFTLGILRNNDTYCFIRSKNHNSESLNEEDIEFICKSSNIYEKEQYSYLKSSENLTFKLFKGVTKVNSKIVKGRGQELPQHTAVIFKNNPQEKCFNSTQGSLYQVNRDGIENDENYKFDLNYNLALDKDIWSDYRIKTVASFKINQIKILENHRTKNSEIVIEPQSLFLFNTSKEKLHSSSISLILTLREPLSKFLQETFQSNAYAELLRENEKKKENEINSHSIQTITAICLDLVQQIKNDKSSDKEIQSDLITLFIYVLNKDIYDKDLKDSMLFDYYKTEKTYQNIIYFEKILNQLYKTSLKVRKKHLKEFNYIIDIEEVEESSLNLLNKVKFNYLMYEIINNMIKHFDNKEEDAFNKLKPKLIIDEVFNDKIIIKLKHLYCNKDIEKINDGVIAANLEYKGRGNDKVRSFLREENSNNTLTYYCEDNILITKVELWK